MRTFLRSFGDEKWPWLVTGWLPPAKRLVKVEVGTDWTLEEYVSSEGKVLALPGDDHPTHRRTPSRRSPQWRQTSGRIVSVIFPTANDPSAASTSGSSMPEADSARATGGESLSGDFASSFRRLQIGDHIVSIDGIPLRGGGLWAWQGTTLQRALRTARRGRELDWLPSHHGLDLPSSFHHIFEIRERHLHQLEEAVLAISRASISDWCELAAHLDTISHISTYLHSP